MKIKVKLDDVKASDFGSPAEAEAALARDLAEATREVRLAYYKRLIFKLSDPEWQRFMARLGTLTRGSWRAARGTSTPEHQREKNAARQARFRSRERERKRKREQAEARPGAS